MISVIFAVAAAILIFFFVRKGSQHEKIPGPKGFPYLGNLMQLDWGNPFLQLFKWTKEYGPIFYLKLGHTDVVVVNSIEYAYDVLVRKGWDFAGRPEGFRSRLFTGGTYGISAADPRPRWKAARKISHATLKQFGPGMGKLEELVLKMTVDFLEVFEKTNGLPIDPRNEIENATLKMISLMVYGDISEEICKEIGFANEMLIRGTTNGLSGQLLEAFPWLRYFGNSSYNLVVKATQIITAAWREFATKAHTADFQLSETLPVGYALMKNRSKFYEDVTKQEDFMRSVCTQLNAAGNVTTARTFYAFLNILLHYPNVMSNVQKEIDKVLGETSVGLQHQIQMPYTKATVLELLRYTSIVPIGVLHKALKDTCLAGYDIKKGTSVIINLWYLHHDESFWQQPYEFQPNRFLDAEGNLVPADHPNRKQLLPFGAGPRVCVGEMLAQARLFLWTVAVLQKFTLKPEDPTSLVPCDPRFYIPDGALIPLSYKVCFINRHLD